MTTSVTSRASSPSACNGPRIASCDGASPGSTTTDRSPSRTSVQVLAVLGPGEPVSEHVERARYARSGASGMMAEHTGGLHGRRSPDDQHPRPRPRQRRARARGRRRHSSGWPTMALPSSSASCRPMPTGASVTCSTGADLDRGRLSARLRRRRLRGRPRCVLPERGGRPSHHRCRSLVPRSPAAQPLRDEHVPGQLTRRCERRGARTPARARRLRRGRSLPSSRARRGSSPALPMRGRSSRTTDSSTRPRAPRAIHAGGRSRSSCWMPIRASAPIPRLSRPHSHRRAGLRRRVSRTRSARRGSADELDGAQRGVRGALRLPLRGLRRRPAARRHHPDARARAPR